MCDVCDHLLLMLDTRKSRVVNTVAIIWLYYMDVGRALKQYICLYIYPEWHEVTLDTCVFV